MLVALMLFFTVDQGGDGPGDPDGVAHLRGLEPAPGEDEAAGGEDGVDKLAEDPVAAVVLLVAALPDLAHVVEDVLVELALVRHVDGVVCIKRVM